jgi:hypothetical protein
MLKIDAGSNEREFLHGVLGDFISRREGGNHSFAYQPMASIIPSIFIEAHL